MKGRARCMAYNTFLMVTGSTESRTRSQKLVNHRGHGTFQYKYRISRYRDPIIKIRRSWDRLIFIMGIPMLVRWHLLFCVRAMSVIYDLNHYKLKCRKGNYKCTCIFYIVCSKAMEQVVGMPVCERQDLFILDRQYHGCWWTGDEKSQDISNYRPEYSGLSTGLVIFLGVFLISFKHFRIIHQRFLIFSCST